MDTNENMKEIQTFKKKKDFLFRSVKNHFDEFEKELFNHFESSMREEEELQKKKYITIMTREKQFCFMMLKK